MLEQRPEKRLKTTNEPFVKTDQGDLNASIKAEVKEEFNQDLQESDDTEAGEVNEKKVKKDTVKEEEIDELADDVEEAHEPEPIEQNPLDAKLFEACADGRDIAIPDLVNQGANPNSKNNLDQYPIHVWMRKVARKVNIKKNHLGNALDSLSKLVSRQYEHELINHLDTEYCTPLSLGIVGDVRSYCILKGFFNASYKYDPLKKLENVRKSRITEELERLGGTLRDVKRDGRTPWHYIASIVYQSKENELSIPGFGSDQSTPLLIVVLVLVIREFHRIGRMDLNARDSKGMTGLDILSMRYEQEDVQLSEADFSLLVDKLREAGCK
jgi:hypothetical protein